VSRGAVLLPNHAIVPIAELPDEGPMLCEFCVIIALAIGGIV